MIFGVFSQGANIQVKDMNDLADGHTVGFGLTNIYQHEAPRLLIILREKELKKEDQFYGIFVKNTIQYRYLICGFIKQLTNMYIPNDIIGLCYHYYPKDDTTPTPWAKYLYIGDIILNSKVATMKAKELIYQRLHQIVATSERFNNNENDNENTNQFEKQRMRKLIPTIDCMRINSKKYETSNVIKNTWYDDCTVGQNNRQDKTETEGYWKSLYIEEGSFYSSNMNDKIEKMLNKGRNNKNNNINSNNIIGGISSQRLFTKKYVTIEMIEYNGTKSGMRFEMIVERRLTIRNQFTHALSKATGIDWELLRLVVKAVHVY